MSDIKHAPTVKHFLQISTIEAISFLILLGIAMPLKYGFNIPQPVKYVGWIHGILFIWFAIALLIAGIKNRWDFFKMLGFFIASFFPVVPFYFHKMLKK